MLIRAAAYNDITPCCVRQMVLGEHGADASVDLGLILAADEDAC